MIPRPLRKGDGVRVIAPVRSMSLPQFTPEIKALAQQRLEEMGLVVSYGKYVDEIDDYESSAVAHRVDDLHDALNDQSVQLVLAAVGGFNSNQLLSHIDYRLIGLRPKRICGYSDNTALCNAIYAQTGLVTYSGPNFYNFGQKEGLEYGIGMFKMCHFSDLAFEVQPARRYRDEVWRTCQDSPTYITNPGWHVLREGTASGTIIGGNLCTLQLLHGTKYMPDPSGPIILFIEDDEEEPAKMFDRDLQSLLHQPIANRIRGVVIGRCQQASGITSKIMSDIVLSKPELEDVPVIANFDIGHTSPIITFPIGGTAEIEADQEEPIVRIRNH